MHNSFRNLAANGFDRNFGGTDKGTADPYVSGYHFVLFKTLPPPLISFIKHDNSATLYTSIGEVQNVLSGACQAVTTPGGTMNKTEFPTLGGGKFSVPTNMDYGNTLTIRFLEYSSLPILQIFHSWFRMIREYRTGTTPLTSGFPYTKSNYTSSVLYWTTKPDGLTVEYSAYYTGVFPTKDPQDSFPGDLATVDKVEIDMDFSIDWVWKEPWVRSLAQTWAAEFRTKGDNYHGALNWNGTNLIGALAEPVTT